MKKAIAKIIKKYPRPDQSLLPQIWITWETAKGRNYCNCKTGKTTQTPEDWMQA